MNDDQPSAAFQEMRRFANEHSLGTRLLRVAAHDYAAARCLLFNGMFEGLAMGAQAIEKCLKAYLIFADPAHPVRKLSHSLPSLLTEASAAFPQLPLKQFDSLAKKFWAHYQARYPDNPDGSIIRTTADMRGLDEFIIFLNESMPCPHNVKYLAGIYPLITFSSGYKATVTTWEHWIKYDNHALLPLLPRISAEYAAVIKTLHPKL